MLKLLYLEIIRKLHFKGCLLSIFHLVDSIYVYKTLFADPTEKHFKYFMLLK